MINRNRAVVIDVNPLISFPKVRIDWVIIVFKGVATAQKY